MRTTVIRTRRTSRRGRKMRRKPNATGTANDELASARKQYNKKLKLQVIGFAVAAGVCLAILLFGAELWDLGKQRFGGADSSPPVIDAGDSSPSSGDSPRTDDSPPTISLAPDSRETECVPGDPDSPCPQRDAFKAQFKTFEDEIEPALSKASVEQWNAKSRGKISEYKEKALGAFDTGDYSSALDLLQGARDEAHDTLRDAERRFIVNRDAAAAAFDAADYETAQRSIKSALLYKPDDPQALAYEARIAVLPEVARLLAAADKAAVENDFRSEAQHLAKVVALDPARTEVEARRRSVATRVTETDFGNAIAGGLEAIDKQDLAAALASLQTARSIFPGRREVAILDKNIRRLDHKLSLQARLREAQTAAAGDDWNKAYVAFQKAASLDDADITAANGLKLAARIVQADKEAAGFLGRPGRLSSGNIADAARQLLERLDDLYPFSPGLEKKARELAALVEQAAIPVSVVVLSDNQTEVLVRGVGRVGKTVEKTILLKPGEYTFEGRRSGYKSVLIKAVVASGGAAVKVRVVCDEPI